jgi:hypothetical protein
VTELQSICILLAVVVPPIIFVLWRTDVGDDSIHRKDHFESASDHDEFQEKLATLVKRGIVEVTGVNKKHRSSLDEEAWFRDKRTGIIYRYTPPDWPSAGHWGPVEDPDTPSYFESFCDELYPTREQYDRLVAALDDAWRRGEIEHGQLPEQFELEYCYFHHPKTDETFNLILVNPYQKGGSWMKVYHSHKNGTWPGLMLIGPPPWRRPVAPVGAPK